MGVLCVMSVPLASRMLIARDTESLPRFYQPPGLQDLFQVDFYVTDLEGLA